MAQEVLVFLWKRTVFVVLISTYANTRPSWRKKLEYKINILSNNKTSLSGEINGGATWSRDLVQRFAKHRVKVGNSLFFLQFFSILQVGRSKAWVRGATPLCKLSNFLRPDHPAQGCHTSTLHSCEFFTGIFSAYLVPHPQNKQY